MQSHSISSHGIDLGFLVYFSHRIRKVKTVLIKVLFNGFLSPPSKSIAVGQWWNPVKMSSPKQLEIHGCLLSTVATDGLVLKRQAISSHIADKIYIILDQLYSKNIPFILNNIRKWNYILRKKDPVVHGLITESVSKWTLQSACPLWSEVVWQVRGDQTSFWSFILWFYYWTIWIIIIS